MITELLGGLADNWILSVGILTLIMAGYWYMDERDDADDAAELIDNVGERASGLFGGFFGAVSALTIVAFSMLLAIGAELATLFGYFAALAGDAPVIAGELIMTIVGFLALDGFLTIHKMEYLILGIVVALIGYGLHKRGQNTRRRR